MGSQTFGAIYIGSYEVRLKIFELASKKKIRAIDEIRSRVNLGNDAFTQGAIGYEIVDELCDVLKEFKSIMQSYQVNDYYVYASSVFRDIANGLFLMNQIYLRTGLEVKLISNSEHRFIGYKSVAGRQIFEEMIQTSAAVVDIGGASIQITLFKDGLLQTTQYMDLGTWRLAALLSHPGHTEQKYIKQMEEYLNEKFEVFRSLYLLTGVDYVIFMNDYGIELARKMNGDSSMDLQIAADTFQTYVNGLLSKKLTEITSELNLSNDKDPLVLPSIVLFQTLVCQLDAKEIWFPETDVNDGIVYDYAQRNHLVKVTHDFDADVISAARNLSEHYHSYSPHIEALMGLSVKIFDTMKKVHGLQKRHKLLLQVATILHDCGKFVSLSNSSECSYQIIMSSEIIGLTHQEREIIALTVCYHTLPLPEYEALADKLSKEEYVVVAKLSAILRVANALDQSHRQKFDKIHVSLKERELVITIEAYEDISLEQALFEAKTAYFENVFSMKPVLKEKRVYRYE